MIWFSEMGPVRSVIGQFVEGYECVVAPLRMMIRTLLSKSVSLRAEMVVVDEIGTRCEKGVLPNFSPFDLAWAEWREESDRERDEQQVRLSKGLQALEARCRIVSSECRPLDESVSRVGERAAQSIYFFERVGRVNDWVGIGPENPAIGDGAGMLRPGIDRELGEMALLRQGLAALRREADQGG